MHDDQFQFFYYSNLKFITATCTVQCGPVLISYFKYTLKYISCNDTRIKKYILLAVMVKWSKHRTPMAGDNCSCLTTLLKTHI